VGRLIARGADTDHAASASRPFGVAGMTMTMTAGVGTRVELHARFGVGVTLMRDSYEFATMIFHRAGQLTTSASLGIGLRWP
jgi:hypothetical protein